MAEEFVERGHGSQGGDDAAADVVGIVACVHVEGHTNFDGVEYILNGSIDTPVRSSEAESVATSKDEMKDRWIVVDIQVVQDETVLIPRGARAKVNENSPDKVIEVSHSSARPVSIKLQPPASIVWIPRDGQDDTASTFPCVRAHLPTPAVDGSLAKSPLAVTDIDNSFIQVDHPSSWNVGNSVRIR